MTFAMVVGFISICIFKKRTKNAISAQQSHRAVFRSPLVTPFDAVRSANVKVVCVFHSLLEQAMGYALAKRLGWLDGEEVEERAVRNGGEQLRLKREIDNWNELSGSVVFSSLRTLPLMAMNNEELLHFV